MKKFILGILVGAVVSFSGSAYANDVLNLIGLKVEGAFPVKVNGKQLSDVAAVIDGTSYLPVRAIGEALNMEVKFDADLGVELQNKGVTPMTTNTAPPTNSVQQIYVPPMAPEPSNTEKIDYYNKKIAEEKENLIQQRRLLDINIKLVNDKQNPVPSAQVFVDMYTKQIAESEARIAEYEKLKAALQQP